MAHLRVTPDKTIEFPMMLYTSIHAYVKLENISETMQCIAFKVKTTAPKKYLVRPSTGVIRHNEKCEVQITLQPLTEEVETCADRFLIQYCVVENDEPLSRDYWMNVDRTLVYDKRLSVAFKKYAKVGGEEISNPSPIVAATGNNVKHNIGVGGTTAVPSGTGIINNASTPVGNVSNATCNNNIMANSATAADPSIYPPYDLSSSVNSTSANNFVASISNSPNNNQNDALLKQKYDELIRYCLAVEKQKNSLQKENETLKKKAQAQARTYSQTQRNISFIDVLYWSPLLVVAFILAKLFGFL